MVTSWEAGQEVWHCYVAKGSGASLNLTKNCKPSKLKMKSKDKVVGGNKHLYNTDFILLEGKKPGLVVSSLHLYASYEEAVAGYNQQIDKICEALKQEIKKVEGGIAKFQTYKLDTTKPKTKGIII